MCWADLNTVGLLCLGEYARCAQSAYYPRCHAKRQAQDRFYNNPQDLRAPRPMRLVVAMHSRFVANAKHCTPLFNPA